MEPTADRVKVDGLFGTQGPPIKHEEQEDGAHIQKYIRRRRGQRSRTLDCQNTLLSDGRSPAPSTVTNEVVSEPSSAIGLAEANMTIHVLTINKGEDILFKILSLSLSGAKAVTILSADGTVSGVTLLQAYPIPESVIYKGIFGIVNLSGLYLPKQSPFGTSCTAGGLSILLNGPDGVTFGGKVGGPLIAASRTKVTVGTFPYRGPELTAI